MMDNSKNSTQNFEKDFANPEISEEFRTHSKQIRLNGQMLRVKSTLHLKNASQVWKVSEQQLPDFFSEYETMPCSRVSNKDLFELDKVKLIRTQNKLYFGQIQSKKKQGVGIAIYKEGKIYEGQFFFNQKSGFGSQVYANGNLYIGQFAQNKKHGQGTFYWFSLSEVNKQKIQQYHGAWWGGLPDGHGQHHKANGDLYIGKFKNGLKHGDGLQIYANGDKYKGQFINGLPEGYGEYNWNDGSSYKGDFKHGARNGYGIWQDPKNTKQIYKGHYMIDKKHGYGIYDWGNGYMYKGYFVDDLRFGEGELLLNGEVQYNGYWQNGQKVDEKPKPVEIERERSYRNTDETFLINEMRSGSQSKITERLLKNSRQKIPIDRKFSADKKKRKTKNEQFQIYFRHKDKSQQKRSKCGHKNCIPDQAIGKMPRPEWKNAWKG